MAIELVREKLVFKRSTKGTHVYDSADPNSLVRTLYISKRIGETAPPELTLVIEVESA